MQQCLDIHKDIHPVYTCVCTLIQTTLQVYSFITVLFMLCKLLSNSFQNFPEGATPSFIVHDISMDFPLYNDVSRGETVLLWYPGEALVMES